MTDKDQAKSVRHMFARLARYYDSANRWMTWGQDVKWRREVIDRAHLPGRGILLDIGAGTGDLALEAMHRDKQILSIGTDFTLEMMLAGRKRRGGDLIRWVNADALDLPFNSVTFDSIVSGYLLRNVVDVEKALAEQYRVLKPGGYMVCLDTTPPPKDFWHLPVRLYLRLVIPFIGGLVARDIPTYRYLPESTLHFLKAAELAECMRKVGFRGIGFRKFMGGSMAIHWGTK